MTQARGSWRAHTGTLHGTWAGQRAHVPRGCVGSATEGVVGPQRCMGGGAFFNDNLVTKF